MVAPHLLHDLPGQALRPEVTWEEGGGGREGVSLGFCYSQL